MKTLPTILFVITISGFLADASAKISRKLLAHNGSDSIENVWVVFADKQGSLQDVSLTPRAVRRRRRAGVALATYKDIPVAKSYVDSVERIGAQKRHVSKWANAASFRVQTSLIPRIDSLSFVKEIFPVGEHKKVFEMPLAKRRSSAQQSPSEYGSTFHQLSMIGVVQAHEYIRRSRGENPGEGILIGVFDSGFRLNHQCFDRVLQNNAILGDSDFVDCDGSVEDPDSVRNDYSHPYYHNEEHGSQTLSLIAGYDEANFMGAAWGAHFVLARTENDAMIRDGHSIRYVELHQEEDNWAAAVEWAESLGVDIVSSSLGYRDGFTDTRGYPDSTLDYSYQDMDGNSTIIARAAKMAARNGLLIVNAMGNEGVYQQGTIVSPADVEEVLAVGMVNPDRTINGSSSTGPTADGRIKPDLVAQGFEVVLPNIYGSGYSPIGWGTSFATPMVTGLVALVKQAHPDWSSDQIRRRILETCTYAPLQDSVDNIYGYGIPDALWACLDSSTLYISVTDSTNRVVSGAGIYSGDAFLGRTDSFGILLTDVFTEDDSLIIRHEKFTSEKMAVSAGLNRVPVKLQVGHVLQVSIISDSASSLPEPVISYAYPDDSVYIDSVGSRSFQLTVQDTGVYRFYADAQYCFGSDTLEIAVGEFADTVAVNIPVHSWPSIPVLVADSPGIGVEDGQVFWKQQDSISSFSQRLDEWGRGRILYPGSGTYVAFARAAGFYQSEPIVFNPVELSSDTLRIPLRPRPTFIFRLADENDRAISNGTVSWWPTDSDIRKNIAVDSSGEAVIYLDSMGDFYALANAVGYEESDPYLFDSRMKDSLTIRLTPTDSRLLVLLSDTAGAPIGVGALHFRSEQQEQFRVVSFDSTGCAAIVRDGALDYALYATAPGYIRSNTVNVSGSHSADTVELHMEPRIVTRFAVFPNVVTAGQLRQGASFQGITIDFMGDEAEDNDQLCRIAVRRPNGTIVWQHTQRLEAGEPLLDQFSRPVRWNCRAPDGSIVAPGIYLLSINHAGKSYLKKVLIRG